jgi:hypothetical protein
MTGHRKIVIKLLSSIIFHSRSVSYFSQLMTSMGKTFYESFSQMYLYSIKDEKEMKRSKKKEI